METENNAAVIGETGLEDWVRKNAQRNAVLLVMKRYSDTDIAVALGELGIPENQCPYYVATARQLVLDRKKSHALWGMGFAIVLGMVAVVGTMAVDTKMNRMLGIHVGESYVGMWMVLAVCTYSCVRNGLAYLFARA